MALITGTTNDDQLLGTSANDEIRGLDGNDVIEGGAGADLLIGGYGNDTYIYRPGAGYDVISEADGGGFDTLYLYQVLPAQVLLSRNNNDLIVRFQGNTDQITIAGFFDPAATSAPIDQFTFSDGTAWSIDAIRARYLSNNQSLPTEQNDTLTGSAANNTIIGYGGNDTISGDSGNDVIYGGAGDDSLFGNAGDDQLFGEDGNDILRGSGGNDMLQGGTGNDTYTFAPGFGVDQIIEGGGFDTIFLGGAYDPASPVIDPQTLKLSRSANDLVLNVSGNTITVRNHFDTTNPDAAIEQIAFQDGTIWDAATIQRRIETGNGNALDNFDNVYIGFNGAEMLNGYGGNDIIAAGAGNDTVFGDLGNDRLFGNQGDDQLYGGDGNDSLWGNAGRDTLDGGIGNDTYYFNQGDGQDVILDTATAQEGNRIVFGTGIAFQDLNFRQDGTDLVIEVGGTSDTLRLINTVLPGSSGPRAVQTLQFSDGTLYDMSNLSSAMVILGSDGNDWLVGGDGNDWIAGNGGDDLLQGMAGNDTLIGGTGNDSLDGGTGDDTYIFNSGDGYDVIWEGSGIPGSASGTDTIQLGAGSDPAMTQLERWGNDLVIRNGQTGEQMIVREHFGSYLDGNTSAAIEQITFADGTIWNSEAISNRLATWNANWTSNAGDTVGGTLWSDYLYGMDGNDTISGGQGADTIDGGLGNDRLFGGEGNDFLYGQDGNDLLAGGAGQDWLYGGQGSDTYLFNLGDGFDQIDDVSAPGETNRVIFGSGIRFEDLHAYYDYWTGGVIIDVGQYGDRLQITGSVQDPLNPHVISTYQFSDGTIATHDAVTGFGIYWQGTEMADYHFGSYYADSLYGNGGDDQLFGYDGNDLLAGGQGFDWLNGGQGNDTYYYNRGDGEDYIDDIAFTPDEGNRVVFGAGITIDDIRLRTDGWNAWLEIAPVAGSNPAATPDILRFSNFFVTDPNAPRSVASFEFADGAILSADALMAGGFYIGGTEYQDFLYGTALSDRIYGYGGNDELYGAGGNDTLIGGKGSDALVGGAGADTYVINRGDGPDIIVETDFPGEANRVVFGEGISLDDLHLITPNGDVYIEIGGPADALIFAGYSPLDTTGAQPVQSFVFADGSSISYTDLIARGYYIGGTEGNDTLSGNDYYVAPNDLIYGFGGDDTLAGYNGNDTLVGGTGNDLLYGGLGSDTYQFNLGDGSDTISDFALPGETNRVVFGHGISANDLSLQLDGSRLTVRIGWYGDQLNLDGFDRTNPNAPMPVDMFAFADGSAMSFAELVASRYIEIYGTTGDDLIYGSYANDQIYANSGSDTVYGFGGDDQIWCDYTGVSGIDILDGGDGNDSLYGGGGIDTLIGGRGDDYFQVQSDTTTVIEYAGEGTDRVLSTVDYTLAANVEILQLAGYVVRGTGNELDNTIYGNSANNILDGGAGIDTMYGYGGNDTYVVDNSADQVMEYGGDGTDTVLSSVTYALSTNVENLTLTGTGAINGTGNSLNNTMVGNNADNMLFGGAGADTLQGGGGADMLLGGLGGDTYIYNLGDGNDTIYELESVAGDVDKVVFGGGITSQGLTVTRTGLNRNDLQIAFAGSPDTLTVANWFNPLVPGQIEQFRFADGAVLTSQQMTDLSNSAPTVAQPLADQSVQEDSTFSITLPANAFADIDNDILTYVATLADGSTLPSWLSFNAATRTFSGTPGNSEVGSIDIRVTAYDRLGANVSDTFALTVQNVNDAPVMSGSLVDQAGAEERAFSYQIPAGTFTDVDAGDVLTYSVALQGGGTLPAWLSFNPNTLAFTGIPGATDSGTYVVEVTATDTSSATAVGTFRIVIADTILVGSGMADVLYGSSGDEELRGLGGDDTLYGQAGNDILVGGTGNDLLRGGVGNDTYVFNIGDGQDVIEDVDTTAGNIDTIRFGSGITATGISLAGFNGDLIITAGGGDQITVRNWFSPLSYWTYGYSETANRIERLEFADGTVIDLTTRTDIVHTITGGAGNETIQGGIENNIISAGDGNDTVYASAGSDLVHGDTGDDTLYGEDGNDTLYGDGGSDTLWGGDGDDVLAGGTGQVDVLYGGGGSDTYLFNLGDGQDIIVDYPHNTGDVDTLRFGAGITRSMLDIVHSTVNPGDVHIDVNGYDGVELYGWYYNPMYRIERLEFADGTSMSAAEIQAWADNVAPVVATPVPNQTATEDAAFSFVLPAATFSDANAGDVLSYTATLADGSALPSWLSFDAATQTFTGTPANEQVGTLSLRVTATDSYGKSATAGFDLVVQNTNDAPVLANAMADQNGSEGQAFSYVIPANTFSDVDVGDSLTYAATLASGASLPSWLSFNSATRTLSGTPVDGNAGSYTVRVTATDTSGASAFDDFVITVADTLATTLTGTSNAETLNGTAWMDVINGLGGSDTLYGYAGNDTLNGGSGADKMYGGLGNDTYIVDNASDVVTENANEGIDTVQSSITWTLGSNLENLTLTGSNAINGTGNSLDNVIIGNSANNILTGNAGNDWLDGGTGSDTMKGGTGNDTYVVNSSGDIVTENGGEGTDTVLSSITYTLGSNVENLTLTGSAALNGTGNSLNNVLLGNSANNTLTGNAGNDILQGLGGNDTLRGGTGNDTYIFGRGDGADTISENDSTAGNNDTAQLGVGAMDVVLARSGSNLVISLHGGAETLTVSNWYSGTQYQAETIQANDGLNLTNTQVDQLIQAMASFSTTTGLTWDQAIDQRPQEVQNILAAYWQAA